MFSDMLNNAVADGLVVIKSIHDLLPARVRKVTEAWPEEVLVITIILVILLNIAFFLTNVKFHEMKKRNRAPASANKTTVEVALVPTSPAKSPAAKKATAKTVAKQDAPASAASPRKPKAKAPAKAKAKPSASKTVPAAEKKFAEECGRWMHSLPARPKAKLLKSLKTAGDDDAKRIAAYRASAVADATKTRAERKEELLAAIAALS